MKLVKETQKRVHGSTESVHNYFTEDGKYVGQIRIFDNTIREQHPHRIFPIKPSMIRVVNEDNPATEDMQGTMMPIYNLSLEGAEEFLSGPLDVLENNPLTTQDIMKLIAKAEFKAFDEDDWEIYEGCNTENPQIAYIENENGNGGYTIVVDGKDFEVNQWHGKEHFEISNIWAFECVING